MVTVMKPFSRRHERAILEKRIRVSVPKRLRTRLWMALCRFDPPDSWTDTGIIREQLSEELREAYGCSELVAFDDNNNRVVVSLEGFVQGAYPSQVLDVVEVFYRLLDKEARPGFQYKVNELMQEEGCPWRLADGEFFQVDSEFLQAVLLSAEESMATHGFQGALEEFREARRDLSDENTKGAIVNACKSFESVLKAFQGRKEGNASVLTRALLDTAFFNDVPQEFASAFVSQVLMALPFLRNKMGGHGQGPEVLEVPNRYARLAVHLAAALNLFVMDRHAELNATPGDSTDVELPF